jgi:flagellar biosynthesis protein FlhA
MDETGMVRGITLGTKLEVALLGLFSPRATQNPATMLTPDSLGALLRDLDRMATTLATDGRPVPLLTPPSLRVGVRRLVEPVLPNLPVISLAELPPFVRLSSVATWEVQHA